jgi:hypothetical protein
MSRKRALYHIANGASVIDGILQFSTGACPLFSELTRPPERRDYRGAADFTPKDSSASGFLRYPMKINVTGGLREQYPALARQGAGL